MKKILYVSLFINIMFFILYGFIFHKYHGIPYIKMFCKTNPEIIFLGDSLTDKGDWVGLGLNKGIGGDTTEKVLGRIYGITELIPSKVFIMVGVNDILNGREVSETAIIYKKIINTIKQQSPNTKIFIQSVLPVKGTLDDNVNKDIIKLNIELRKIAKTYNAEYIDLHTSFLQDEKLDPKYSLDGVHLNNEGYLLWKSQIRKYIN